MVVAGSLTLRATAPAFEGIQANLDRIWDHCQRVPGECSASLDDYVEMTSRGIAEMRSDQPVTAERLMPVGLLDGVLVVWRTTLMLRQVARLYGLTLGPTATFHLLRRSVRNAALAGVADIVSHAALEHVGASITAMLSARAGQGAGNALLASRLGLEAIRLSRPLPYITLAPPRLKQIRDAIFDDGHEPAKTDRS